ncbi:MAG: transcriptional regulator NrdR [Patescibacteria group bacterium]|nr:transcriptional regulator NrdR [Patescibacteria group bacterium]
MHCPVCNHEESKVVDSRLTADGTAIRRRRECDECGYRFSTVEEVELLDVTVVKRDGHREMYSREKLAAGIRKALEKRPFTQEAFRSLINQIESDIAKKGSNEVTAPEIGEVIMERLRSFDKVAYIRFASVYRSFEDVKTFQRILDDLKTKKQRKNKK